MANQAVSKYHGKESFTEDEILDIAMTMDVAPLTQKQRAAFLWGYAKSRGLDPMARPFDLIPNQSGSLIIYANRSASDQLRKTYNLRIETLYDGPLKIDTEVRKDVWITRVRIQNPEGRFEDHVGAVDIDGLTGTALANAIMKCATKASRRGTLAFCGLSMPDESEVETFARPDLAAPIPVEAQVVAEKAQAALPATTPPAVVSKGPKVLDLKPAKPAAVPPVKLP